MRKNLTDELKNVSKIADNLKRQINQIKNGVPRGQNPFKTSMSKKPSNKDITTLPNLNKNMLRSASGPALRGKIVRGNNFDGQKLIGFTRNKVVELQQKL